MEIESFPEPVPTCPLHLTRMLPSLVIPFIDNIYDIVFDNNLCVYTAAILQQKTSHGREENGFIS